MSQSPEFEVSDTDSKDAPASQLDIYQQAVDSTVDDDLIEDLLLGLGNYSDAEHWQQVESFRQAVYSDGAFASAIGELAIEETMHRIAKDGWHEEIEAGADGRKTVYDIDYTGWHELDDEEQAVTDRRRWITEHAEKIWEDLPAQLRVHALIEHAGTTGDWKPPQLRMLMMRHESSRSRGARLIDNLFGRVSVNEVVGENSDEKASKLRDKLRNGKNP
ncbi:hypothetical protein [Haloparvum sp. AD34]